MLKITIGITTFNRMHYLKSLARSLYLTEQLDRCNIRLYDDCSTEYTLADLKQLFPTAALITTRKTNLGADRNMWQMFIDFLATTDELLVIFDADLICRPDWVLFMTRYFAHTDGILSLYNSMFHQPIRKVAINGANFIEKDHIGAAGTIFNRKTVQTIVTNLAPVRGYDWAWSALLRQQDHRLLVSADSYFQHIGLEGYNCNGLSVFEYAHNFHPIHQVNQEILAGFFQKLQTHKLRINS